jgi:hypothetical protein
MGTLLLAAVMPELRKARLWRKVARWERLVYLASAVMVAVPIVIAAANSFDASANGAGGPPVLLVVLGGVGLTAGLATLMRRRTQIGLLVAALLAAALMAGAIITARCSGSVAICVSEPAIVYGDKRRHRRQHGGPFSMSAGRATGTRWLRSVVTAST